MLNPQTILTKGWGIAKNMIGFSDMDSIMDKALSAAKNNATPETIFSILSAYAQSKGKGKEFLENQTLQSFRGKSADEIIPHGKNVVKQLGLTNMLLSLIMNNNKQ